MSFDRFVQNRHNAASICGILHTLTHNLKLGADELQFNGVFTLLLVNVGLYVLDHILHLPMVKARDLLFLHVYLV